MPQVRPDDGALPGDVRCLIANGVGIDDEPIPIGASAPPRLAGSLPVPALPLAEVLFRGFVARDTRVVQDSLSRPEALPGGEGIDSPTPGCIPVEAICQGVGIGVEVFPQGGLGVPVDHATPLAA